MDFLVEDLTYRTQIDGTPMDIYLGFIYDILIPPLPYLPP